MGVCANANSGTKQPINANKHVNRRENPDSFTRKAPSWNYSASRTAQWTSPIAIHNCNTGLDPIQGVGKNPHHIKDAVSLEKVQRILWFFPRLRFLP
jgi:hypothetical protein